MKALSIKPFYATVILMGQKTVEWRSWKTDYRGDLLICASSSPWCAGAICKNALCVGRPVDIVPFTEEHLQTAYMDEMLDGKSYAWQLDNLRSVEPFEVKGKLSSYDVDGALVKLRYTDESRMSFAERCYKLLVRREDKFATREEIEGIREDWMSFLKQLDS